MTTSPHISNRPITTRTKESAHAAAVSNPSVNWEKISVVNVWNRSASKAPYSAMVASATRRQPPANTGRIWRRITRKNTTTGDSPRLSAISSTAGSALRSPAATGRYTSGKRASDMTRDAPHRPFT